ncbi:MULTISPECIES: translesion DNA synthesis-associated protein ImuA [unclassified Pseudomonas]|uniref:translesion DNA synthesis-associated protein ImuA n=1 Tax=unclassified Pseudomonas TaxID=196821 RepID=UPI00131FFA4F|nr:MULTISPECIES: translesion DNA synthesis-associated protein ImuA [unclassified Pseudomonas]MDX9664104.1 translesion DNA synthesis-associated protein ImuA [Pseudomonas sp. P5_152]QHD02115.1 DNA lesion error-prone repair protein ImuA [Pseudomonas sp. S04]QHF34598.1 DNA lesion error-prone repair protein ImuA [Pseudomonas sp. S19]
MGAVVALDTLFHRGQVWKGRPAPADVSRQPTGHAALDAALPSGGWPEAALSEILIAGQGVGELQLVWPALARLTADGERVVLVAPPCVPYPQAWQNAGIDLRQLSVIQASDREALWAAEQCLRSGSCGAVLCWPKQADDRALRRLQVAAETGQTLAFAYRSIKDAINPSPAALRIAIDARPAQLRVLKCRGGLARTAPIAFAPGH